MGKPKLFVPLELLPKIQVERKFALVPTRYDIQTLGQSWDCNTLKYQHTWTERATVLLTMI
jgi:hypothetical protein